MNNMAKIISISQPLIVDPITNKQMNANDFIAYCARVSNPSNQMNTQTSDKLLKYCIKNNHWSIFEMVNVVMEINTTRDIARQILRHRSFSFQEFSQRYADPVNDLGFTLREARLQDVKNRQNSFDTDDKELQLNWNAIQTDAINVSKKAYAWAISNGIAKEQARTVLPEGLTLSRMYMNGSLRSWIHYCMLRCDKSTQKEHREVAVSAASQLSNNFSFLKDVFAN
jgi:thymidylate synthase (FAD)